MPSMADSSVVPSSATPRMSRCRSGRRGMTGMNTLPRISSTIPMGTLTRKIPRQDQYVTNTPPSTGPMMPPIGKMLEKRPTARSRSEPKISETIPVADGMKAPPPIAWTARSTMSR